MTSLSEAVEEIKPQREDFTLPKVGLDFGKHEEQNVDDEEMGLKTAERQKENRDRLQTRYPSANEKQLELLGVIDESIDNSVPKVYLPRVTIEDLGGPPSWQKYVLALKLPLLMFAFTLPAAILIIFWGNPIVFMLYPYIATILTFLSSVPPTAGRFDFYYDSITKKIDQTKQLVEPAVEKLSNKATKLVHLARDKLDTVLEPLKEKLRAVTDVKQSLQQIKPDVVIPDVSDLDQKFDDSEGKIRGAISDAKSKLEPDQYIPEILRSRFKFHLVVVFPILFVLLLIQVYAMWQAQVILTSQAAQERREAPPEEDGQVDLSERNWEPIIAPCQTFVIAVLQITIAFLATQAQRLTSLINGRIKALNDDINTYLKDMAGKVFHDILDVAMNYVKERILQVIDRLHELEGEVKKIENSVKVLNENVNMINENVEKVTGQAELIPVGAATTKIDDSKHVVEEAVANVSANCCGGCGYLA